MATEYEDGWGSNGLGLGEDLFGGAERVKTFSDPDQDTVGPATPAKPVAAPTATLPSAVAQAHAPSPAPVFVDPLRAAREALLEVVEDRPVEPAQWGARAVLRKSTGGLLRPGAGKAERAYTQDLDTIRTFQWPGAFSVLVANKKGGVGKTPTTLLLAGVLAQVRAGGAVAFEGAEAAGTLAMRAEGAGKSVRGLTELLVSMSRVTTAAELAWFTQPQTSGAAVIGSVNDRTTLEELHVRALRRLLDQYYLMSVVDTGNNPESGAFLQCIDGANALVLPTPLDKGAVVSLIDTLLRIRNDGPRGASLAASAVVLVSDSGKVIDPKDAAKLRALLDELGVGAVVDVPYDPHIAAGNEISLGRLSPASQRAWVHATATVLACATSTLTTGRTL